MKYFKLTRDDGIYWIVSKISKKLQELNLTERDNRYLRNYDENFVKLSDDKKYKLERFVVDNFDGITFGNFNSENKIIEEDVLIKTYKEYTPRKYKNDKNVQMTILSGDKHFCYEDKDAIDILEQVCKDYREEIDEFIDGGDGINNNALSKFIDGESKKYTLYEEMKAFENHMWRIKDILPDTKFIIVEDNHYHLRKARFLAENPAMVGLLKDINFPFDVKTPHGTPYFPFGQNRIGVIHGLSTNDNFTKAHSQLFKEDIINFHTHGSQHYTCKNGSRSQNKQAQKMWGMPSMCIQMDYMNGRPSRSNTGFGILRYNLEYDLYDLQYIYVENGVAIYNGKTYKSRIGSKEE